MTRPGSATRRAEQPTPADARQLPANADANGGKAEVARPAEWPADAIERRPLDTLIPYAKKRAAAQRRADRADRGIDARVGMDRADPRQR